jgi:hypothetical protein
MFFRLLKFLFPPHFYLQLLTFMQFGGYTLVRNSKDLFESFGFDGQPVIIGLIIFMVCYVHVFFSKYYRAIIFSWRCIGISSALALLSFWNELNFSSLHLSFKLAIRCIYGFHIVFIVLWLICTLFSWQHTIIPVQHVLSFCLNLVSRAFEFQVHSSFISSYQHCKL